MENRALQVEGAEQDDEEEEAKHTIATSSPPPATAMGSPMPSSSSYRPPNIHNDEDSDSPPHPIDSPTDSSISSNHSSIHRERTPSKSPSPPSPPAEVFSVSVKRSVRDGPPLAAAVVAKVDTLTMDGPAVMQWADKSPELSPIAAPATTVATGVGGGGGGGERVGRRLRPDLSILRRARRESMVRRAQLVSRVCGCLFCLVAFSVMAADKEQGWALDSFYRYKEFRLCLAVGAIGFVYSGLQAYALAYQSATGKHLVQHRLRPYLDFSLDQMLSYLLISATSSAATRVDDWQMNWGKDKFPQMATASVAVTVLAFLSFAVSSVISFYTLCTVRSY